MVALSGGAERHRLVVATPGPAVVARLAPHDGARAGGAPRSSGDAVWATCRVAGPRDDRLWYRLEDGTFLPEDVLVPDFGAGGGTPPPC